jgi:acetyl/propionyl-CoA carboxylase alpha subunit
MHMADFDIDAEIVARRPQLRVRIADAVHVVTTHAPDVGVEFELSIDGVTYRGWRCLVGNDVHVRLNGRTFTVHCAKGVSQTDGVAAQQEIRADMPGVVVAVHCERGQVVKAGDRLLTMESMKLQVTLVSSHDATVEQVHVAPATVFERGALLVSFTRSENGGA